MFSFFNRSKKQTSAARPLRRRSVRLLLERLEDRLTPTGPTLTALASFTGTNGASPSGGLIVDSSGNLYGTTNSGTGANSDGTIFEWVKSTGTLTTLASFAGTNNGSNPFGGLIMDSSGNLYGTTSQGGANGDGTVFEWLKSSGTITKLNDRARISCTALEGMSFE